MLAERTAAGGPRWDWRKALDIAWSCVPRTKRVPAKEEDLVGLLNLRNTRTIRTWKETDPEIEKRIAEMPKQLLAEQGADRQAGRAHLLARVELERQREVRLGDLALRKDIEQEELTRNQEIESQRLQGMMALETRRWQAELDRRTQEAAVQRAQQSAAQAAQREGKLQDALSELEIAKAKAKTQAELDRLEREEDRLDVELGALALERMQAVRRKEDAERMRMGLERKAAEIPQGGARAPWTF